MPIRNRSLQGLVALVISLTGAPWAQVIPDAPPVPDCSWDGSGMRSTCKFKDVLAGTPTSVAGNRVIVFNRSTAGAWRASRGYLADAVRRLASRYGFTATITEDPAIFSAAHLADAKVVIIGPGEGDVVPRGENRAALEAFQLVNGWGMIWIHAACAHITAGWPFGQRSCVQQYYGFNASNTPRRMFIDSGTAASPNHGIRNPRSEFLLRNLPGWGADRALLMRDGWFCFRAPARNTDGVNVLFGYDRASGPPPANCPEAGDASPSASQNHNMAWTHGMGNGITLYNSWGQDEAAYTAHGNMGDSLLWRFIRYAAKDWCSSGGGEPGCDASTAVQAPLSAPLHHRLQRDGFLSLAIPVEGRISVSLLDIGGRHVAAASLDGPGKADFQGLRRGLYLVQVLGAGPSRTHRIMAY